MILIVQQRLGSSIFLAIFRRYKKETRPRSALTGRQQTRVFVFLSIERQSVMVFSFAIILLLTMC